MVMLADAIRLLLFPALMAFAASSDLFTMTISNRVTLILVAGFFALALLHRDELDAVLSHVAAAVAVLAVTFTFFAQRLDRRRRRQACRGDGALAGFRPPAAYTCSMPRSSAAY